jgi:hypothetical protein
MPQLRRRLRLHPQPQPPRIPPATAADDRGCCADADARAGAGASGPPRPARPRSPAAAAKPLVPSPGELARLYAVRAEYELKNGKPRDALVSVAYGLQADPEDNVLRELRARALQQLRVRAGQ